MNSRLKILLGTVGSTLGGGVFYAMWMAVFLLCHNLVSDTVLSILWLFAPVITALGFTAGRFWTHSLLKSENSSFRNTYLWSFIGCTIGTLLVYWYGPMLIVFSMLVAGAVSVFLMEIKDENR
jgi:hypothetical protein